jgi:hypothetical protein
MVSGKTYSFGTNKKREDEGKEHEKKEITQGK